MTSIKLNSIIHADCMTVMRDIPDKYFELAIVDPPYGIGKDGHPTQKPIALYRWLLQNYAKPGDKIIDTHSGSGSCAIACHLEKHDFLAIDKDEDYYKASVARLDEVRAQGTLF